MTSEEAVQAVKAKVGENIEVTKVVEFNHPINDVPTQCFAVHVKGSTDYIVIGSDGAVWGKEQFWRTYSSESLLHGRGTLTLN